MYSLISKNRFFYINKSISWQNEKSNFWYKKKSSPFLDNKSIQFLDIKKLVCWYQEMDLFISKHQFLKSKKCDWFLDVQKSIFWYQEMDFFILKFTRGSAVFHNTMRKLTSIIQSLYLYFIKIVPFCPHPPFLRLCIALFAVAEGWLLLDIGWFVLFYEISVFNTQQGGI